MERPAQRYFCNKCGYVGNVDLHPGCGYLAYHLAPFEQNYIDQLERELALLKTSPASVPAGYVLVPVVPTHAILDAMFDAGIDRHDGDLTILYRAILAAAPTPPENKALLEAVAEVVWYDPQLSHFHEKPGKIIDGSIAFMESAKIGTKLFSAPTPPVIEDRWQPIATAPKDGTKFLAWRRHSTLPLIVHYNDEYSQWEDADGILVYGLTHWMPLPKAPAMQEGKP